MAEIIKIASENYVDDKIEELDEQLTVERSRINNIVSLEEGSTTGDAELSDIRVDINGNIHSTAGEAVRNQFNTFSGLYSKNLLNLDGHNVIKGYFMYSSGTLVQSQTGVLSVSEFIPVKEGTTYSVGGDVRTQGRMITAFDSNKNPVYNKDYEEYFNTWTCPSGIKYVRVSYHNDDRTMRMNEGDTLLPYEPYGIYISPSNLNIEECKYALGLGISSIKTPYITKKSDMSAGSVIELEDNCVKTYKKLVFTGTIKSFDKLHIGHGKNTYASNYIVIDNTNVIVYESGSVLSTFSHGLTIKDNIQVSINQDDTDIATIKIVSSGSVYENNDIHWFGTTGMIFAESDGSELTDCVFTWTCLNYSSNVYAFGDSYFGIGNESRWVYHLLSNGYKNNLIDGYAGRNSANAYLSFERSLQHGTPKIVLWCLGMNDSDGTDSVNTSWLNTFNNVKEICMNKGIEFVGATIPTTPTVNNKFKNEIVRNAGIRYIDFAKAVGDEGQGVWYDGMISTDSVHPTTKGAIALYMQAIADLPELMG